MEWILELDNGEFISGYSTQFLDSNEFWKVLPKPSLEVARSLEMKGNHVECPKLAYLPKKILHYSLLSATSALVFLRFNF